MKKFLGTLCSFVAAALAFVFLSLPALNLKDKVLGTTDTISGWQLLSDDYKNVNGFYLYKIFAIVLLVVAGLLIISGVLLLLKNFGKLKLNANLSLFNNILLSLFALSAVVTLVGAFVFAGDATNALIGYAAGIGPWLNSAFGLALCLCGWFFANKDTKKKSRKRK